MLVRRVRFPSASCAVVAYWAAVLAHDSHRGHSAGLGQVTL